MWNFLILEDIKIIGPGNQVASEKIFPIVQIATENLLKVFHRQETACVHPS